MATGSGGFTRLLAFWLVPVIFFLLPASIATWTFFQNKEIGSAWTVTTAKATGAAKLCFVEKKENKNWNRFSEGEVECAEADAYVQQNSSLTNQLRTVQDDYLRFTYQAGGVTQDKQTRLFAVANAPVEVGQDFLIVVNPTNATEVHKPFDATAELKTLTIWLIGGLVAATLAHLFARLIIGLNDRFVRRKAAGGQAKA